MTPEGWERSGSTAIVRMDTGDTIAKTFDGTAWWYEAHIQGGASWFCLKSLDDALAVVHKARGNVA
jgi:hypothetical protein